MNSINWCVFVFIIKIINVITCSDLNLVAKHENLDLIHMCSQLELVFAQISFLLLSDLCCGLV